MQKQSSEMERKEIQNRKDANFHRNQFKQKCSELGIEGKDVHKELKSISHKLPSMYEKVVEVVRERDGVKNALEYYLKHIEYVTGAAIQDEKEVCPHLRHLLTFGNETLFEKKKREDPQSFQEIQSPQMEECQIVSIVDSQIECSGIDWEVGFSTDEAPKKSFEAPSIVWDSPFDMDSLKTQFEVLESSSSSQQQEIVWDIKEIGNEKEINSKGSENNLSVEEMKKMSILSDSNFRKNFSNDLKELSCFFSQKLTEIGKEKDDILLSLNLSQNIPTFLQKTDNKLISNFLSSINSTLNSLNDKNLKRVTEIASSSL